MEGSVYQYYANVRTEPVEWLWYPYIPLGKLTVLQGDPGEGKSTFALNVVARITTGQPMPDGVPAKGKRVAIYQCAEDGIADTIKPRLQQAGADCERVAYIIDNDIALTLEDGRIETAIKDTHASVFIIDPIQAFIPPDADMQSATKMRSVLRKLANIADRNKCAVILIGHMNKGNGAKTLYRGLGSIDIAAIARSVPFPVSWTVKMKKKQKETQDILSYHTQAAGCSDKARAKASGGRQPIEECGRTGL